MSLREVCRLVRAVSRPYPGAFTEIHYRGSRVTMRIWEAVPYSGDLEFDGEIGTVVHEVNGQPLLKCRDGMLLVKDFLLAPPA
jgi:hypothetical protein